MGEDEKSDQIQTFSPQTERKGERQKGEKAIFGAGYVRTNGTLDRYVRIGGTNKDRLGESFGDKTSEGKHVE